MYQVDFNHPVHVYFIGIGGISMSGLAEILLSEGFTVSGSDWNRSASDRTSGKEGRRHPLRQAAESGKHYRRYRAGRIHRRGSCRQSGISPWKSCGKLPSLTRAQLLGQMMKNYRTPVAVSGTHGKTTTTSMITEILLEANTDPTISVGGILKDHPRQYPCRRVRSFRDGGLRIYQQLS